MKIIGVAGATGVTAITPVKDLGKDPGCVSLETVPVSQTQHPKFVWETLRSMKIVIMLTKVDYIYIGYIYMNDILQAYW